MKVWTDLILSLRSALSLLISRLLRYSVSLDLFVILDFSFLFSRMAQ